MVSKGCGKEIVSGSVFAQRGTQEPEMMARGSMGRRSLANDDHPIGVGFEQSPEVPNWIRHAAARNG